MAKLYARVQKPEVGSVRSRKSDRSSKLELHGIPSLYPKVTIEEAVAAFLEDELSRHLSTTTTGQSKTLLEKQLIEWAQAQGLTELEQLTVPLLSKFRATWTAAGNNASTARRKHQRLSGFLWFCVRRRGRSSATIACLRGMLLFYARWKWRDCARLKWTLIIRSLPHISDPRKNRKDQLHR